MAGSKRLRSDINKLSCPRSASTADCMSGYCSLQANSLAIERGGAMNLTERSGGGRMMFEFLEACLPVGAEFGAHAALHESPAHRRRLALQLHQFAGIFGRHRVRNGGEQLRHLHDRTLQAAERRGERQRITGAVGRRAQKALARDARGDAADFGADGGVALGAGGEAVLFAVGGHGRHLIVTAAKVRCPTSPDPGLPTP